MSSSFVISLDFELMWGVRDKRTIATYGENILGGRVAIPRILKLFHEYDIQATWATVGLILAKNKAQLLEHIPAVLPDYRDSALSPYEDIYKRIGNDEKDDPWHYGGSLVEQIRDTPGQEIASHTFSHFYCLEEGQSLEAFKADLAASISIANIANINIESIVFPRNQMTKEHIDCCYEQGLKSYRGSTETYSYRPRKVSDITPIIKGIRFIDSMIPIEGNHNYPISKQRSTIQNVPASRILRPAQTSVKSIISALQLNRIKCEMKRAAVAGKMYHLWWHPHNFGCNLEENLDYLKTILQYYQIMQTQYGMRSQNIASYSRSCI